MRPLVPAGLLALFLLWCGAFGSGAGLAPAAVGTPVLVALGVWGIARGGRDPLMLGPFAQIPWLLAGAVVLSLLASPVPRAGLASAVLLPALLVAPAALATAGDRERRRVAFALSVAVLGVTGLAVVGLVSDNVDRAAEPLEHHLLLGTCLVIAAPLAVTPFLSGRDRLGALGWLAVLVLSGVVVATRSLAAAVGLVLAWAVLLRGRDLAIGIPVVGTAGAAVLGARVGDLLAGADVSARARLVYWRAAMDGALDRLLLGSGPGSSAWTLHEHYRPVPGVNPPGEIVGDPHGLPFRLVYELGLVGTSLAVALAVAFALLHGPRTLVRGDALARGGLAGLLGGAVSAAVTPTFGTGAVPVAFVVAASCCLPAGASKPARGRLAAGLVYALSAVLLLVPALAARMAWERARLGDRETAIRELDRAMELDPSFPLYRFARGGFSTGEERAGLFATAARDARGLPSLWLAAGAAALPGGEGGVEALLEACRLDPLAAPAPFLLATARTEDSGTSRLAARSFLADPRLAAARWWAERSELREWAIRETATWDGVDRGWRDSFFRATRQPVPDFGESARIVYEVDADPATSLSLHAFRRPPWPADLAAVEVDRAALDRLDLPPATALPSTDPWAVGGPCVLDRPDGLRVRSRPGRSGR